MPEYPSDAFPEPFLGRDEEGQPPRLPVNMANGPFGFQRQYLPVVPPPLSRSPSPESSSTNRAPLTYLDFKGYTSEAEIRAEIEELRRSMDELKRVRCTLAGGHRDLVTFQVLVIEKQVMLCEEALEEWQRRLRALPSRPTSPASSGVFSDIDAEPAQPAAPSTSTLTPDESAAHETADEEPSLDSPQVDSGPTDSTASSMLSLTLQEPAVRETAERAATARRSAQIWERLRLRGWNLPLRGEHLPG